MAAAQNPGRQSRARAFADPVRTERLMQIAELMARGTWVRGKTAGELAAEWGLSQSTVEDYSSEASRWVKLLERPRARLRIARALDSGIAWVEDALDTEARCKECGEYCGHGPLDAIGKLPALADKYAALTGANEPTAAKLEHSGRVAVEHDVSPALAAAMASGDVRETARIDALEAMRELDAEDRAWVLGELATVQLAEKDGG